VLQVVSCKLGVSNNTKKEGIMGYIYAKIALSNPRESDLKPVEVNALVDTGAITLCIPEHIMVQLKLIEIEKREVTISDGRNKVVPYVGPIQVNFERRTCFTGALVLGDSVLMGVVPMEDMDLVLNPTRRTIIPNPESPNIPHALVK
jgi:clan AA aspartic protease